MLVAHLDSGVAGHVAAQLFLVDGGVDVGGDLPVAEVGGGDVQSDELDVGVHLSGGDDGGSEGVAGGHDDVVALGNSGVDHGDTLSVGVLQGLEVVELNAGGIAVGDAALVGGLVEGLVGDVAVVGDHSDLVNGLAALSGLGLGAAVAAAAGQQAQDHNGSQDQGKITLHNLSHSPLLILENGQTGVCPSSCGGFRDYLMLG